MEERVLPRDFTTPPELIIPLSNTELQELGTFVAIWSQIDWMLMVLTAHITKTALGPMQLIEESMTTGLRVGLLMKLCQRYADSHKPEVTEAYKKLRKLLDKSGGLIEDRNHLIHGVWGIDWNYDNGKTTAACLYQKGNRKPIPAEKLTVLSDRATELSNQLGQLLEQINPQFSGQRPRRFFFGDGSPQGQAVPSWPPK